MNNLLEAEGLNSGHDARNRSGRCVIERRNRRRRRSIRPLVDGTASTNAEPLAHSIEIAVRGDGQALQRVILNLLSNSAKRTKHRAGFPSSIEQLAIDDGAWAEVVVSDTGSGIPPELVAQLGGAFALNILALSVPITSLEPVSGLAICKGIAAAHSRQIHIQSVQGAGTTATLRIRTIFQGLPR